MLSGFFSNVLAQSADLEQQMLYRPYATFEGDPSALGLAFENVWLQTSDGVRLHGWWIPGRDGSPTLLYCHGNGGNISHRLDRVGIYHGLGYSVFLFDYRGYGKSAGTPNEKGTYRDAAAAWEYLTSIRHIPGTAIVLYGESLGCAIALETALHGPAAGLILESPFTSTVAVAQRLFPQLPVQAIIKNHYDNLAKIALIKMPLLILHSPDDQTVPFAMGQALFDAAPQPKTLVRLRGSHVFGYRDAGSAYPNALKTFTNSLKLN